MLRILTCLSFVCGLFLGSVDTARSASTDWVENKEVSVRLIGTGNGTDSILLGLHFKLADGWKAYWRTPGDGGMPPTLDSSASINIKKLTLQWPVPERFLTVYEGFDPIENFGYKKEVVFPINATLEDPEEPAHINMAVNYAVCAEICIFLNTTFNLDISPTTSAEPDIQALLEKSLMQLPKTNGENGLRIDDIIVTEETLEVHATSLNQPFNSPDLFIEVSENFRFPKPEATFSNDKKSVVFHVLFETLVADKTLSGNDAILTLTDGKRAVEKKLVIEKKNNNLSFTLLTTLLAAFLGGLILNIMPCVLPVLSIKLLGVVKHGGSHTRHIRYSFLMSAAGIISSFLLLAGIVIFLRSIGTAVGWGFHFHEPLFLIFLVIVLNLFAANQWSLFELSMPSWVGKLIPQNNQKDRHSGVHHFLTGAFATLLATPCTAPFLGTAVSFALSQGTFEILLIFTFMGIGLAFPYIIFALIPHLVSKLPRPGAWMAKVKSVLGFFLFATALWLIFVLSNQLGALSALVLLGLSVSTLIILWVDRKFSLQKKGLFILLIGALSFYLPAAIKQEETFHTFDPQVIPTLVSEGKIVFVDVTADWCLTCKFNKINVINDNDIQDYFNRPNIIYMVADYTLPSNDITQYLRSFNRYGIPFNVVYGPNAPDGITLPELLSKEGVINALKKAEKPN